MTSNERLPPSVFTRVRKRDGATVYYYRYRAPGRRFRPQVTEKAGAVKKDGTRRAHNIMAARAATLLEERRIEIDNGTWVHPQERRPAPTITLRQLVDRFLKEYEPRSGSIRYYEERSKTWLAKLPAARPAVRIGSRDIERFRDSRGRKVSPSTVRKDLVALSTMFRWAQARGLVSHNPASPDLVRRPREPRKSNRRYLTHDEEAALLAKCIDWLQPIVRWALETGMDREEILLLRWTQIDEEAGVIEVPRRKTGVGRAIPLTSKLRAILKQARRVQSVTGDGRVFLGPGGKPISVHTAKSALRRAYAGAELEVPAQWKTLRHTLASRLAMADVPAAAIARMMGHTTQEVTDRYMHLSPGYLREARDRLEGPAEPDVRGGGATEGPAEQEKSLRGTRKGT